MRTSAIGWTDHSGGDLNMVTGCTPVSRGCDHCYGRAIYERFGRDYGTVTCHEDKLERLWRARFSEFSPKRGAPHRPMAFLCDTGDLFHEEVPETFVARVFALMLRRPHVTWQVLTKRPARMRDLLGNSRSFWMLLGAWNDRLGGGPIIWPADYVWLGVSVEDQATADERVPLLLDTLAAVRFVSVEPMLGPVDLRWSIHTSRCSACGQWWDYNPIYCTNCSGHGVTVDRQPVLDWVVAGFESGLNRRPGDERWALDLREQCREAGVPFFGKQTSGLRPGVPLLLDGVTVHEWPREV